MVTTITKLNAMATAQLYATTNFDSIHEFLDYANISRGTFVSYMGHVAVSCFILYSTFLNLANHIVYFYRL